MIELIALALAYAGFAALALAMNRHHRQVWHRVPSMHARLLLRGAGTVGLASSLAACVVHAGWSIGPVLWLGSLSAVGIAFVLLLAFRPHIALVSGMAAFSLPAWLVDMRWQRTVLGRFRPRRGSTGPSQQQR